jgi:hypothetical protein
MTQEFQQQHAARVAQMSTGDDVLAARVTVDDETLAVRAGDVGRAIATLNGDPLPGTKVVATIEYVAMTATEFAALPDYQ